MNLEDAADQFTSWLNLALPDNLIVGAEPIDQVFDKLAEFIFTKQRGLAMDWKEDLNALLPHFERELAAIGAEFEIQAALESLDPMKMPASNLPALRAALGAAGLELIYFMEDDSVFMLILPPTEDKAENPVYQYFIEQMGISGIE